MLSNRCSEINRKLSAYMDGELKPGELAAVRAHLPGCAVCAGELKRLADADSAVLRLPAAAPAPFFAARVSAAVRAMKQDRRPFLNFQRLPLPAMAAMVAFILINIFTFAFNLNAMENGPRRELARKVVAQLARPSSLINPVAVARLCDECSRYMCQCMHEAGKQNLCPCKDCRMGKGPDQAAPEKTLNMEKNNVH